jgi:hypothetical protein
MIKLSTEPGRDVFKHSRFPGLVPIIKALKWRWATEARPPLKDARALRKWGERSET